MRLVLDRARPSAILRASAKSLKCRRPRVPGRTAVADAMRTKGSRPLAPGQACLSRLGGPFQKFLGRAFSAF